MSELRRILRPNSIALIGGLWARNVYSQLIKSDFKGEIWPINPKQKSMGKHKCYPNLKTIPGIPDVAFIAVNRLETIKTVKRLSNMNAGGAICFASGFLESKTSDTNTSGKKLQHELVKASGPMPIIGPNCYGILNYLDNICLWPDQHGGKQQESGVAIIAQSSNIAINLTMQKRSVPIAYVITIGNQAKTGLSKIIKELLNDSRVTAIGLYIEGFDDINDFQQTVGIARSRKIPIVAIKTGKTSLSRTSAVTHTASISGSSTVSSAFFERLGIIEVNDLSNFLETLKIFHFVGDLESNEIASVSCSGGEASLIADLSKGTKINYRDFKKISKKKLSKALGPIVTISNPFDYHTFIWGDTEKMTEVFSVVLEDQFDLVVFILDVPRVDHCDNSSFQCAINAITNASRRTGQKAAVIASLPEAMPEELANVFIDGGVLPLCGMETGITAIQNSVMLGELYRSNRSDHTVFIDPNKKKSAESFQILRESDAKLALSEAGVSIPRFILAENSSELIRLVRSNDLKYPLVLKGQGKAHKTDAGLVILNISESTELTRMSKKMLSKTKSILVEEMVMDNVFELCIAVIRDTTGMFLLSIRPGGTLTELFEERVNLLLPVDRNEILTALKTLKIAKLLFGFRNTTAPNIDKLVSSIQSIAEFTLNNADTILELEVNPLIVGQEDSIAVDVLLINSMRN
ncbi:MAG: acetate--CoA ligase family protein [Pseudomonadota bacterium]|nr:acetate--CoA ligase family protein [Pseudomonadota bacterium]